MKNFESTLPFEAHRIHATAVYCSDGRFGDHLDDFLHNSCGWPGYDRVALPGGPVYLASNLMLSLEQNCVERQLDFLLKGHEIENVALIAHEGCSFYRTWLKIPPDKAEARQLADLAVAAQRVKRMRPSASVYTFIARRSDNGVTFEKA